MSINVEIDVDEIALRHEDAKEVRVKRIVMEKYNELVKELEKIIEKKYDEIGLSGLGVFDRIDLISQLSDQKKRAFSRLSELRMMEQVQTLEPVVTQPRDTGVFRPQPSVKTIGASL